METPLRHGSAWIQEKEMANEFSGSEWRDSQTACAVVVGILEERRASVAEAA